MSTRAQTKLEKLQEGTIYRELDPETGELIGDVRFGRTSDGLHGFEFCLDKGCWKPCELPRDFRIPVHIGTAGFFNQQEAALA